LISAAWAQAIQPHGAPLSVGEMLPPLSGQTVANKPFELPAAVASKASTIIFSFSRTGGKDARLWNERLMKDFPNAIAGYQVILLQSVPKMMRGMVMLGIKSSMPVAIQERTLVLYQDEELWKLRLTFSDDKQAYVLLLGADGRIRWKSTRGFAESEYLGLRSEVEKLVQSSSAVQSFYEKAGGSGTCLTLAEPR
jgi:hypothetical protein